jgi:hypothetical protein
LVPLISFNDIVVDFNDVLNFNLKSIGATPEVEFSVRDRNNLLSTLDTPGNDNVLHIQILPPFDNAYKKINLNFYITNISISNGIVTGKGMYKVPKLISSQFKSMGEITSYKLFEDIAIETELGFATNVEDSQNDKRYVYCDNISYLDTMRQEILKSASDKTHIYDFWIDFWNNINFVDIYERYNSLDNKDDMLIWVSGQYERSQEGMEITPVKTPAIFNNHPTVTSSELFVSNYAKVNKPRKQMTNGSDKVISCYEENKKEYRDFLIMDGDIKQDIFTKHEYIGEVYGDYNYLLASKCRDAYLQKMGSDTVVITLRTPLLGVMRGDKVEFVWYINNSYYDARNNVYKEGIGGEQLLNDVKTFPDLDDTLSPEDESRYNDTNGDFVIDKSVSGQYMVCGQNMKYVNGKWDYEITLVRPAKYKPQLLNEKVKQ